MRADVSLLVLLVSSAILPSPSGESALDVELKSASAALDRKDAATAQGFVDRALERDSKSTAAWDLRARCAEALGNKDAEIHALHAELRLSIAQKRPPAENDALRARIVALDSSAQDLFDLAGVFVPKLKAVAEQYEKDKRPHSAIRAYKEILALDPDSAESTAAIQRIAAAPNPSLAGDAKPKDLFAGVSEDWIRARDKEHASWEKRDKMEREHYVTSTDTGYQNLVRTAEAMEQLNAFYREFFQYGIEGDGHAVPRIELRLFRSHEEYLKKGSSPAEWSAGQFTGDAVETYIDQSFNDTVGVFFHEAAHQFVGLATQATGWLNEGLASFFEGTRILANGTVLMNLPANHRLMPMVDRLQAGWMTDEKDGIDQTSPKAKADSHPKKAPTFRIVLEDKYEWGPPWYDPTWSVVYFLYNYQDPLDGRYVYRAAFRTFINKSGRAGKSAVKNFEETVLAHPEPPVKDVPRPAGSADVKLPKTVEELDEVWKNWLIDLKKEQNGEIEVKRPYLQWARYAVKAKNDAVAREHFEKAIQKDPRDADALLEFAAFLAEHKGADRASKLGQEALKVLESRNPVDEKAVQAAAKNLAKWDPKEEALENVHKELWAAAARIVGEYDAAGMKTMVLDLSWRFGIELGVPGMLAEYESTLRSGGQPVQIWHRAYNEKDLEGWAMGGPDNAFHPKETDLETSFGSYDENLFDYRVLTLDTVTSGDWSLEADVLAEKGKITFCGLVFGKKGPGNFHGLFLFPGRTSTSASKQGLADTGFVDLASCFGDKSFKTWRHVPVKTAQASTGQAWHKLRIDVAGGFVDTWFDGEFLTTQEFPSNDPLRGNFGLITGPGSARFRNVRFLSRLPLDPTSRIDRAVRMEKFEDLAGPPPGGSYLGRVPMFPAVEKWVQGERKAWREKGPVPQLLVFWSTQQNDLVRIDEWLRDVSAKNARFGLEIVSIASPNDSAKIADYLKTHTFPGTVAVDKRDKPGLGNTFETYCIDRFNLPRVLLLGIDGKVVWEGDPGFTRSEAWAPGKESYLDTPLAELVEKNHLEELFGFTSKWTSTGSAALKKGDLATALPILKLAKTLPAGAIAEVDEARKKLAALEAVVDPISATLASFARDGVDPAIEPLIEFSKTMKKTIDKNTQFQIAKIREGKPAHDWNEAAKACETIAKTVKPDMKLASAKDLAAKLPAMEGRFPKDLLADLGPAVEAGDVARVQAIAGEAPNRPKKWLTEEYLHW